MTADNSVCAEFQYMGFRDGIEIGWVHSDVCPPGHEINNTDEDYRKMIHACLDEWLDKSDGSGYFFIGDAKFYTEIDNWEEIENWKDEE